MDLKITQICNAIKVTIRVECMSDDNEQQLRQDLEICEFLAFS